jgi:hypothetical protein
MNERLTSIPQHALAGALFTVLLIGTPAFAVMPTAGASPTSVSASSASAIDIRDIRGPIPISSAWLWSMWVAGGVTLGLSAIGAWRWNRQRKRVAAQPAFELALERLRAARALMQPPTVREFSITVSDIVRSYIEERFQVMAAHRTTEEFLHDLLESPDEALTRHRALLVGFLRHCDLAKFAGWSLTAEEMEITYESARIFCVVTGKSDPSARLRDVTRAPNGKEPHDSLSAA